MRTESLVPSADLIAAEQGANAPTLADLQRHEMEVQLRASDIQVQIGQLREQQAFADPQARSQFNGPLADAQHQYTAAMLDYEATRDKRIALQKELGGSATTIQRPSGELAGRLLDNAGFGAFLLMIPIVFAFSRRIWIRSGAKAQPAYDLESSPRLQRLEEAVESIAIEIERIGEAQRFATKLLSERRPEAAINRVPPASSSSGDRVPGTITPH
jgi:hypothetical protein